MEDVRKNFEAKDIFNTSTALSLNDLEDGATLTVKGVYITEKPDKDGVVKPVCYFKTEDDKGATVIYGTISNSVIGAAVAIPELLEEGGALDIRVVKRKSANNRKYNLIELV